MYASPLDEPKHQLLQKQFTTQCRTTKHTANNPIYYHCSCGKVLMLWGAQRRLRFGKTRSLDSYEQKQTLQVNEFWR